MAYSDEKTSNVKLFSLFVFSSQVHSSLVRWRLSGKRRAFVIRSTFVSSILKALIAFVGVWSLPPSFLLSWLPLVLGARKIGKMPIFLVGIRINSSCGCTHHYAIIGDVKIWRNHIHQIDGMISTVVFASSLLSNNIRPESVRFSGSRRAARIPTP